MKALTLLAVMTIFTILALAPVTVFAQNLRSGDVTLLGPNEVIEKDYFAAGETVIVQGTVNGDAYLAGGNVTVTGTINGDLLTAGGNVEINGTVNGDVRVAGGNIYINGNVSKNITALGGSINLANSSQVEGGVVTAGGNISLNGAIASDVTAAGGQVGIGGKVGGDITGGIGQLVLYPQSQVAGNLTYWSDQKADIYPEATVAGSITQHNPPVRRDKDMEKAAGAAYTGAGIFFTIVSFLTALIFGALLLKLFPVFTDRVTGQITKSPFLSFGVGLLAIAVTPILVIMLILTLVGIPFALVWMFVLIFDLWLSKLFIALVVGFYIMRYFNKQSSKYLGLLSGLAVYYLITWIPVAGWLIGFLATVTGFGSLIISKRNYYLELRDKKTI